MPIKINYKLCCWKDGKCNSCGCGGGCNTTCIGCVEACPVGALKREKLVKLDKKKCLSCGACVVACKHGAISLD